MKNATRKKKGSEFEKFVMNQIREHLDPKCKQTTASGAGLDKMDLYCPTVDWMVECKNHKSPKITQWIAKMKEQSNDANIPLTVFKNPNSPDINPEPYVIIGLYDLIDIYKENSPVEIIQAQGDREMYYKLNNLKSAVQALMKHIKEDL